MKCPVDDTELVMADRQGVEIDYCPKCRGVWLDRGELDKIIERAAPPAEQRPAQPDRNAETTSGYEPPRDYGRDHHENRPRKKKSLLGEIFDF
ncbi:zf-TFIIB domain-containing protein [Aurantimonas sp. C2-6-R+9]|uniref:TFIIB-type zinc ribbon-containing protein n=1 Tax=unclassified Aurantimonas TaxID=2638230 RepID=UPI002E184187|nr:MULTISPECIES: zf-TFIIB domain-containing protein [unclassified Aurantimonas]MEC5292825.1 zf-TFIIB domain-containing protein [Aurantimonas sp. C2-3-R2]MEC5383041.1 zf-TFIIB domain-containing protein [Aurantimonas sp. C2-6-R+9]MEC5413895.1 zf-TFIIB domain-containing protein [Aurantimonas sp. C2-4-R8]